MLLADILKTKKNVYHLDGASDEEIYNAENELGLSFAPEYKDYLKEFSLLSYEAHELTGLCKSSRLNVVEATKKEKEENPNISKDMYLLEYVGVENLSIWQNTIGEIYEVPYMKPAIKICDSLLEYISNN